MNTSMEIQSRETSDMLKLNRGNYSFSNKNSDNDIEICNVEASPPMEERDIQEKRIMETEKQSKRRIRSVFFACNYTSAA